MNSLPESQGNLTLPQEQMLREEYFFLQKMIESFDGKALNIKTWSITLGGCLASTSLILDSGWIPEVLAVAMALFWLIEAQWKTFQYAYYRRINEIEVFYSQGSDNFAFPRISGAWVEEYRSQGSRRFMKSLVLPHVVLPYLPVILLSLFVLR